MAKVTAKRTFSGGRDKSGKLIVYKKGKQYESGDLIPNVKPYFYGFKEEKKSGVTVN